METMDDRTTRTAAATPAPAVGGARVTRSWARTRREARAFWRTYLEAQEASHQRYLEHRRSSAV